MTSQLAIVAWDDWLAVVVAAFFVCVGLWVWPRVWRDQLARGGEHAPGWWPWGEALWQGYRRIFLPSLILFGVLVVILSSGLFIPEEPQGPFVRPYWAVIPGLTALGLAGAAMLSTVLFNVPKFLVPPHLRHQPGAVAEWVSAWQRWRQGRRRAR